MNILTVSNMYPSEKNPEYGTFIKNFFENVKSLNTSGTNDLVIISGKRKGKLSKLFAYLRFYSGLTSKLLLRKYDLVYVHTITFPIIPLRIASTFRHIPIVFNVHGDDVLPSNRFKTMLKNIAPPLLRKAELIVTPSEYFRGILHREFPGLDDSKIFTSPSGGIPEFFFKKKTIFNEGLNPYILGFVSRIDPGKGWDTFVLAIKKLRLQGINVIGKIIGDGSQTSHLLDMIEKEGQTEHIEYLGAKGQSELPSFYNSFDLFIFPTSREAESLGLVGIEAMAAGTPVIAANIGGPAGYIQDGINGFLFEPRNVESLSNAVKKYIGLDLSAKKTMSEKAYNDALGFETKSVMKELYEVLDNITIVEKKD